MDLQLANWFAKLQSHSYLEPFRFPDLNIPNLNLFVKRDDLIHSEISGNKLRKLKGNLLVARKCVKAHQIMTFGGAYSNHLLASAAAAHELQIPIIGVVRGEELNANSNPLLQRCEELGMQLKFVSRADYQAQKHKNGHENQNGFKTWCIPEGGANPEGVWGCTQIYSDAVSQNNNQQFDAVFIAQGTTTTSLGILASLTPQTQLFVVPVLKGFDSLAEMQKLALTAKQNPYTNRFEFPLNQVEVLSEFHHGGYAKTTPELLQFTSSFNATDQFPIEPVYTAKALFALKSYLIENQQKIAENPKPIEILFVHTGGVV